MCLYTQQFKALIATQDIVCYKIVYRTGSAVSYYKAPYIGTVINKKCIDEGEPYCAIGECIINRVLGWNDFQRNIIEGGCIHTYADKEQAIYEVAFKREYLTSDRIEYYDLFECIIPQGIEYYYGVDSNGDKSYASKSIIFKEKLCV